MKFKFNWGWGIFFFILLFFASIIWRVTITSSQKINLVTPDYYPKGIAYEDEIIKKSNYDALDDKLDVYQDDSNIYVKFPKTEVMKEISGTVLIYRPADYDDDSLFEISLTDSFRIFQVSKSFMKKGLYQVKADWQEDSIPYYTEKYINIKK